MKKEFYISHRILGCSHHTAQYHLYFPLTETACTSHLFSSTVYYFAHAQVGKPEDWAGENYRSSSYLGLNLINLPSYWVYLADFL